MIGRRAAHGFALAIAAFACSSGPSQLYEGPARPDHEVALIAEARGSKAKVYAIDEDRAMGDSWTVASGPHVVWVNFHVIRHGGDMTYTIWSYCRIDFEAAAGGAYRVESFATQELQKGASVKTAMGARIVDARGAAVGFAQACTGERPRLARS